MIKKILLLLLFVGIATNLQAAFRMEGNGDGPRRLAKPAAQINSQLRVHDVGKVWMSITNFGFFGSQDGAFPDVSGKYLIAPSCMFPGGSNLTYLFQGALWIGAVIDTTNQLGQPILDTLVSIGNDGWWGDLFEMFPSISPGGAIQVRSTRPSDVYPYGVQDGAKSEQDYIAEYTDTVTSVAVVAQDPNDGRAHIPLGIQITQRSYAWSYEYAEDFILFDFDITNIGHRDLKELWVGLYIDADVYHSSENPYSADGEGGAQDDICGFDSLFVLEGDTNRINTAWIADNDGQPYDGAYDYRSPRGVSGVRVVRTPLPEASLRTTFNWWISNTDATLDWGPRKESFGEQTFPGGGLGTPGGDIAKYKVMSNGEFDYDQMWCGYQHEGWIPPPPDVIARNLANGYDTRYLFSFGPFPTIPRDSVLKLTTAYICGDNFHTVPSNYLDHLKGQENDSASVQEYYNNLHFDDFATNAQWADWVYDNPGVDTDSLTDPIHYRGEYTANGPDTFWFKGDGVPDFAGPPPPDAPKLTITPGANMVSLLWDGNTTETKKDVFSNKADFEGYRVYMSKTGRSDDYTLLGEYDLIDYDLAWTVYDTAHGTSQIVKWNKPPRRLDEFVAIHSNFDWRNFQLQDLDSTHFSVPEDTSGLRLHWEQHGWNTSLDAIKVADSTRWYQFQLTNLAEAQGLYFSVTAYDYGDPVTKLSPLETATAVNAQLVYPVGTSATDKVAVYPNPYIFTDATKPGGYLDRGWEDPDRSGNTVFDRRIKFQGLPPGWVIRIFTLDGDLVKQINQGDSPYTLTDDVCYWDLISRNTQSIVSGIYIYVIDGDNGHHELGKLAIIR